MENFFIVPAKTYGPFLLWISSLVFSFLWAIFAIKKIEKSGVKRHGATGSFWKPYEYDE